MSAHQEGSGPVTWTHPRAHKNDHEAKATWKGAYGIPKSVFALVAWHLASLCADACNEEQETSRDAATIKRFAFEVNCLYANGILSASQHKAARRALKNLEDPQ